VLVLVLALEAQWDRLDRVGRVRFVRPALSAAGLFALVLIKQAKRFSRNPRLLFMKRFYLISSPPNDLTQIKPDYA